jgi:hypothetical protein
MSKSAAKKGAAAKTVDPVVRMHQAAIAKLRDMSSKQLFNVAVSAGIYTQDGKLTPPYRERGAARRGSKG